MAFARLNLFANTPPAVGGSPSDKGALVQKLRHAYHSDLPIDLRRERRRGESGVPILSTFKACAGPALFLHAGGVQHP